jgi:type I restriction enzyme, S subunit
MTQWREITLGAVARVQSGYSFKSSDWAGAGVPVVKIQNVRSGRVDLDGCSFVSEEVAHSASRFRLATGDVLVTMSGEIGEIGVVRGGAQPVLNQRVGRIEVTNPATASLRYLGYALQHPSLKRMMESIAYGTAQPNISPSLLASLPIRVPDLRSQEAIADLLDTLDDLIENHCQRVALLEGMCRATHREWFVHYRYPGHEQATLGDSVLGPIPEAWNVGIVDDFVQLVRATTDPSEVDPDTPAVGLEHLPRRRLTLDRWGSADGLASRKTVFRAGDLLFGKIRPYFHKVCVAPVDGVCSTDAIVIRPHDDYWGLAVLTASSDEFVANAAQTANGTKMPRADWKVLKEFGLAVPPLSLARRFTEFARESLGAARVLMLEARELGAMRDLLLPRLVSGQIDVAVLPDL